MYRNGDAGEIDFQRPVGVVALLAVAVLVMV